jgi:hypothetical protein
MNEIMLENDLPIPWNALTGIKLGYSWDIRMIT